MRKSLKAYSHWSRLNRRAKISAEKQAIAIQQWPVFRLITDLDFGIIKASTGFLNTFNLNKDHLPSLGKLFIELANDQALCQRLKKQLLEQGITQQRFTLTNLNLSFQHIQCQAELIHQPSPHLIWRLQAIPQASNHLELASLTAQIFQQSSAAMLIMDADFNIVSVNPAFSNTTGFNLAELQGKSITQICANQIHTDSNQYLLQKLSHNRFFNDELLIICKNKQYFPAQVYVDALVDTVQRAEYYLLLMLDISVQKQRESELRYHAEVDPLTKLGNRKLLFQSLENAIASAKRFNYTVAVLFLDLDGFKQINDHFGHGKGDDVLQEVAERLQKCVRQVDTVGRLGGDEFVVILNGTSKDMIAVTALRIIDFLTLIVKDQTTELQVSASIGISVYPQDSNSPIVLLKYADEAMYKAKEQGKSQFCWHFEP